MNHSGLAPLWCVSVRFSEIESELHLICTGRRLAGVSAFRFSETGRPRCAVSAPPWLAALLLHTGQRTSFPTARAQVDDLLKMRNASAGSILSPQQCVRLASWLRRRFVPCTGSWLDSWLCGWRAAEWAAHFRGSWRILLLPPQHAVGSTSNPFFCWIWGAFACKKLNHLKLSFLWVRNTNFV